MSHYSSLLILYIISVNYWIIHALPQAGIAGGFLANKTNFPYQVAIFGRHNHSSDIHLLGSGAIISSKFVASAAQCFVDNSSQLLPHSFSVASGIQDLNKRRSIGILVEFIYIGLYDFMNDINDFAVLLLSKSLFHANKKKLKSVELPNPNDIFTGQVGVVSGFGYNSIETQKDVFGQLIRVRGGCDYKLRAAPVEIVSNNQCSLWYPDSNPYKYLCGIMYSTKPGERWGICALDAGAPLVIQGTLVGIASRSSVNCDDTEQGALYSKIKYNLSFIKDILENKIPPNSLKFKNRVHLPPPEE